MQYTAQLVTHLTPHEHRGVLNKRCELDNLFHGGGDGHQRPGGGFRCGHVDVGDVVDVVLVHRRDSHRQPLEHHKIHEKIRISYRKTRKEERQKVITREYLLLVAKSRRGLDFAKQVTLTYRPTHPMPICYSRSQHMVPRVE